MYKIKTESGIRRARFIRKRGKIIRRSLSKVLIAKTEIKYTNDKAIVTVNTVNREKDLLKRKILFFRNLLKLKKFLGSYINKINIHLNEAATNTKNELRSSLSRNINKAKKDKFFEVISKRKEIFALYVRARIQKKRLIVNNRKKRNIFREKIMKLKKKGSRKKRIIPKLSICHKIDLKKQFKDIIFKRKLAVSLVRKKIFLKNIFLFSFLK